jgi:translocator protein
MISPNSSIPSPVIAPSDKATPRLKRPFGQLLLWVALCFAAAALGGLFPPDDWFRSLNKPSFQPPDWLFGPVWSALYALMGTSMWLVWTNLRAPRLLRSQARSAFLFQLALNALWTPLFFGAHAIGLALIVLVALVAAVIVTIARFARVDKKAAWMLAPYLVWISFATVLNASLLVLNR